MSSSAALRLHAEIETPQPLRAHAGEITLAGWCFAEDQTEPPPVRVVTSAGIVPLTRRTPRTDVPKLFPHQPAAENCGFVLSGSLPAGVVVARFEAQSPDGSWQGFKQLTLSVEPAPFAAVLDEPVTQGVLRDRVKVGGWALEAAEPVTELTLRYGHREIPCEINLSRTDVPALFPGSKQANHSGFRSQDFLVAGHGSVRARARLASGRVVVASTKVTFSVGTDENHPAELDLTAPRVGLSESDSSRPPSPLPPAPALQPLKILFVLHGSFASNSALHVAALANELAAAGHACAVAVPHDVATLAFHDRPAFRGLTFAEAEQGAIFPDGARPDIIHAWTTRENVRLLTQKLGRRYGARVLVHLEDNEQQLLAVTLGRDFAAIDQLDDAELDRIVPSDLSHPHHSRAFLAAADGVTVITERLREFVPAGKNCLTLWPAADARHFYPRPRPVAFRRVLDPRSGETVIFYPGNVHAANAAEMRELYTAVVELNRTGQPVTLIRTGLDRVAFPPQLGAQIAPFLLSLGQIEHHRHLPALMALADIFVQPGEPGAFNDYRFPSKLPEFFALGRPVVLPRSNLGTLIRHGIDAYVLERADAAGIATAVRILRADPALAERLGRGAAAFAEKHFSWRRSAEALAKFYLSLTPS
ncbi:MAG: glycosyltransferase family 4 protein [Opitutaceae bacterium]